MLSRPQFEIVNDVLYHVESDKTLRIIPTVDQREKLFGHAHSGLFGGHLRSAKIHSQLAKHFWWPTMRADIVRWCRVCQVCATRQVGKPIHPFLSPIPISGSFDRVGVDVIQFPPSSKGNKYDIVFMDYLTKWPEVFPSKNQNSLTIARLLIEQIIPRHGVPVQLLSDRGTAFLSKLMKEVYKLLGLKKVNIMAYHLQTDGLVERFNRTLTDMLSKKVMHTGRDWDIQLPYVLFAYRASTQDLTGESPFFLLYGRDPVLPTREMLQSPHERTNPNADDYTREITLRMSTAWKTARVKIKEAQKKQKCQHDKKAKDPRAFKGDRVFVYSPAERSDKAYKFARPFKGPYRVVKMLPSGAELPMI